MSREQIREFVREFNEFKDVWNDGRNSNPKDVSEEFTLKAFNVYKNCVLSESSEGGSDNE